ncbi:pyridoxamine 5'-phosphate oxidase family protein [Streptomyces sp. 4503]|uniref:Pyridoxamine 5'-phosphate oxidase family protein n=1 Tax=Streptomyces niphimycinicus TaxID=2842201 RepID=A0ABS6C9F5_9ACTN|nr:pyridoxamine 5'-phosphate oxidase family protein [Streptomyces niphimycinicus]MBU3863503.1 pyridoxamine 5'-phosphate oxidase family protein [Streptomyces niphimycinicus]
MKLTRDDDGTFPGLDKAPFDVAAFLARPLVARLATEGPRVRPVWFLWEDHAFWVLTGPWARLAERLARDPVFELVVDSCDLATGTVHQVIARGRGRVVDFDTDRGRRKLTRYLGEREELWDARFSLRGDPSARGTRWALLVPDTLWIADLSFRPPGEARTDCP